MWEDPIVKETRAAREQLVEEFGGDLDALWEHLQKTQERYRDRHIDDHTALFIAQKSRQQSRAAGGIGLGEPGPLKRKRQAPLHLLNLLKYYS